MVEHGRDAAGRQLAHAREDVLAAVVDRLGAELAHHADRLVTGARRSWVVLVRFVDDDEAVVLWSRLHGFVSLEIGGNFASMGLDADALFARAL